MKETTKKDSATKFTESNHKDIISQISNKINDLPKKLSFAEVLRLKYNNFYGSTIYADAFIDIIISEFQIKKQETRINGQINFKYYKFNNKKDVYEDYNLLDLGKDLNSIRRALKIKGSDVKTLLEKSLIELNTLDHETYGIKDINLAPNYLIKFNNGIFNKKENIFIQKNSDEYKNLISNYDFINMFNFNYLSEINSDNQYLLVYNKLIKDLANNKEDQILLFNQLVSSVIEGNGRGKYIMLSGQAGSGKTTFGNILKHIAGQDYTRYVTMDSFDDDNTINSLSMSTRLILGDDLQKSAKLVGKSLRYFKTLIDGNQLSVAVKYEPNRIVQTRGLWLQMMNDNPNIYEANDAIKDRTILVKIEGRNHRNVTEPAEKEFSKRLDKYTGKFGKADENFIQVVVSHILNTVDYFDEFTISEEMKQNTDDMVNDASWAYRFTNDMKDTGLFNLKHISVIDMKNLVFLWIKENNPDQKKPSAKTIKDELSIYLKDIGYYYNDSNQRFSSLNKFEFNQNYLYCLFSELEKSNSKQSNMWSNSNNIISDQDIEDFKINFPEIEKLTINDISEKELLIAYALGNYGNSDIMSWILATKE